VQSFSLDGRPIARMNGCRRQPHDECRCQILVEGRNGRRGIENATLDPCGSADMSPVQPAKADRAPIGARRPPFDSVTIAFHWTTVLIVLAMFATAWLHSRSHDDAVKAILLQTHRSLGVTIWVATVLRLAWRLTNAKLPPFPSHMTNIHRAIVKGAEYCLYALLLIQPATGLADTLFRGRHFALFFWQIPPLVPTDAALRDAFQLAHLLGAYAFGALVIGHAGAALFHHFVLRDDVLHCMAPVMTNERPNRDYLSRGIIRNQHL
jgi:cytochrome b561